MNAIAHGVRGPASVIAVAASIFAATACGADDDGVSPAATRTTKAVACHGQPLVLGQITSLDGPNPNPAMMGGVKAAVAQVNHDCSAGRPIELVFCDDHGDPSQGADCGRKITKRKAIALVASGGIGAGNYEPIVQGAGIPSVANLATDPTELLKETSFPFYNGLARVGAYSAVIRGAGAKSVAVVLPDNPALQSVLPTFRKVAAQFGMKIDRFVLVPTDATDLAQYASQASESDAVMILMDSKAEGLLHELLNAGITPQNKVITAPALAQHEIDEFGDRIDGLLMAAPTVPLTDTANAGVAQYLAETKAAGVDRHGVEGIVGWRATHVLADLVKQLPSPTPASLTKALQRFSFAPPEAAPVDFTKHAFPDISNFKGFRIFARKFAVWRVDDGKIHQVLPGFVDPSSKLELR